MTINSRENRRTRRPERTPALWQPGAENPERAPVQQAVRSGFHLRPRWISGFVTVSLILVLLLMFTADSFYVHSIAVGGLRYMTADEIYGLTNVVGLHAFWIDPTQIRADILRNPTIADAQVIIGWSPNLLTILISEREPALVWEQNGQAVWIDVNGRVMRQREDRPELLRVQAELSPDAALGESIDRAIVAGALQLQTLLPEVSTLRYHPDKGLGTNDRINGWVVWLGIGTGMPERLRIYDAISADLGARGVSAAEVNLANPDAPHVATLIR